MSEVPDILPLHILASQTLSILLSPTALYFRQSHFLQSRFAPCCRLWWPQWQCSMLARMRWYKQQSRLYFLDSWLSKVKHLFSLYLFQDLYCGAATKDPGVQARRLYWFVLFLDLFAIQDVLAVGSWEISACTFIRTKQWTKPRYALSWYDDTDRLHARAAVCTLNRDSDFGFYQIDVQKLHYL